MLELDQRELACSADRSSPVSPPRACCPPAPSRASRSPALLERRAAQEGDPRLRFRAPRPQAAPTSCRSTERIATFDNDGTLWTEQPVYFQFAFAIDRVKALAPQHPEWKDREPFKSVLANDIPGIVASGEKGLLEIVAATHTGMTTEEFAKIVSEWIATARHPRFNRPYIDLVYQPMLELMTFLRANQFKTFIVSGGGIEFMRPWTEKVYGIPPEQVVGSSGVVKFELRDGKPVLIKEPKVEFIDDGPGKPVGINRFIGRRADLRLRQLRRRPADAGIDRRRRRPALHGPRPSHRCRARIRLRPPVAHRQARQGARRSRPTQVDRGRHEGRLEHDLSLREEMMRKSCSCSPSSQRRRRRRCPTAPTPSTCCPIPTT